MTRPWARCYAAAGDDPRDTLLDALARFDEPGLAVDLGCGNGRAPAQDIAFLPRERAEDLLAAFEVERFEEVEEDSQTVTGEPKHRHVFHVVARRR